MKTFLVIVSLLLISTPSPAQTGEQIERYRLAQAYEQNGEPEEAARIYEDLLAAQPTNDAFFSGVARTHLALKRYDTLAVIVRSRIVSYGASAGLYSLLGRAYFHGGKDKMAIAAWDSALAQAGTNESSIRQVTNDMIAARAYQIALDALTRVETASGDKLHYAGDRANLYALLSRYGEATREYVNLLIGGQMSLALVENRLSYYTTIDAGYHSALEVVREAADKHDDNLDVQYLFAWLLMEGKAFTEAFDVYVAIDERRNAAGQELVQFAMRALSEGSLDVAFRAFEKVRALTTNDALAAWAEFGAASVHERLWRRDAQDSALLARSVADEYDAVTAKHVTTTWADSATLRSAIIRSELYDFDGASSRLRTLIARNTRLARTGEPDLMLAEILIGQNHLDSATAKAITVLRSRSAGPNAQHHARFLLGQLLYYNGLFDSAATTLIACTDPPNALYANDAIMLTIMIQENKDSLGREALRTYAAAELAARQHDIPRAIAGMQEIVSRSGSKSIAEYALASVAADYAIVGQYAQSRATYQKLLDQYPESILRDRAQMRIASLLEGPLHDPASAIRAYELLLQNYPGSIFLEEARNRIRTLRAQL